MSISYRVISIGTLAANSLWNERIDVRTGHATSALIETESARIIVDPSLPPAALAARLSERTNVTPDEITHVFLTSAVPDHRRAIGLFESARWTVYEPELEAVRAALEHDLALAREHHDREMLDLLEGDRQVLRRLEPAPDRIEPGIDLFPLPGVTVGTCGLILSLPGRTVLITGDAVASAEHLEQGKVLPHCVDLEAAQDSFREAVEIADIIIPGRDNLLVNPLRRTVL